MKYILPILAVLMAIFGISLWTSCDKETCDPASCVGNNKGCNLGRCDCLQGFEGPNCDTYSYEKFIGNYNASETCTTGTGSINTYQTNMYISLGYDVDVILINNIYQGGTVDANINFNNLAIRSQSIGATTIEGEGEFFVTQRQLRLSYQYFQGNQSGQCTTIMTKL